MLSYILIFYISCYRIFKRENLVFHGLKCPSNPVAENPTLSALADLLGLIFCSLPIRFMKQWVQIFFHVNIWGMLLFLSTKSFIFFRDSIDFGQRQLCISEELDSPNMRAEAYLNLARSHERLGALDRALAFARHRYSLNLIIILKCINI